MKSNDGSAVKAGILGMLAGMAAGAALVFFSNPSNREKVKQGVGRLDSDAKQKLAELKASANNASTQSKKALANNLKTFVKQLES